jgi:hypothetical protein
VYPGIDVVYYGNGAGLLEFDFIVAAGADPSVIQMKVSGAPVALDNTSGLVFELGQLGQLRHPAPVIYQRTEDGSQLTVAGSFKLSHDGLVGISLGTYRRDLPLVIDPVLSLSSFLGCANLSPAAIVLDGSGNIIVSGYTGSGLRVTAGVVQGTYGGGSLKDVFVMKLSPSGSSTIFSTYIGGSNDEYACFRSSR